MPWTSHRRMASDAPAGHIGWARCPPKQQTSPKNEGGDAEGQRRQSWDKAEGVGPKGLWKMETNFLTEKGCGTFSKNEQKCERSCCF